MGGSGGGGFFSDRKPPEEIAQKIRNEEEVARDDAYDIQVAELIKSLLSSANDRDVELIQSYLESIKTIICDEIEGTIDLKYGGSVAKHTYVDGLSDIDCLAIINKSELKDFTPNQVKEHIHQELQSKLQNVRNISIGNLAVTVTFEDNTEIQILPAIKTSAGVRIPSTRYPNEWSHVIRPDAFATALSDINAKNGGKLVPTIKLAKSIISSFPENRKMTGYHVESLALEAFKNYTGDYSHKQMLKHFFNEACRRVLYPIRDKTGQSLQVDVYLGDTNSLDRKMVSDSLSAVARKMQNADGSHQIRIWQELLK